MTWNQILIYGAIAVVSAAVGDTLIRKMRKMKEKSAFSRWFRKTPHHFGFAVVLEDFGDDMLKARMETNAEKVSGEEALVICAALIANIAKQSDLSPMEIYRKLESHVSQLQVSRRRYSV